MENYKALNELNRDGEFEFGRTANKIIAIYYFRQQRKWKILRKKLSNSCLLIASGTSKEIFKSSILCKKWLRGQQRLILFCFVFKSTFI